MSFKLTIEVADTKLAATLRSLTGHKVMVENIGEPLPPKKLNGTKMHSRAESLLTMTGKMPNKGSKLSKAREIFEKLEKRKGVGTITVEAFRKELVAKKQPKQLAQRCVTEKVLAYL
jgi:hypothetical protein